MGDCGKITTKISQLLAKGFTYFLDIRFALLAKVQILFTRTLTIRTWFLMTSDLGGMQQVDNLFTLLPGFIEQTYICRVRYVGWRTGRIH